MEIVHELIGKTLYWFGRLFMWGMRNRPDMVHRFVLGMRDGCYLQDWQPWLGNTLEALCRRGNHKMPEKMKVRFLPLNVWPSGGGKAP